MIPADDEFIRAEALNPEMLLVVLVNEGDDAILLVVLVNGDDAIPLDVLVNGGDDAIPLDVPVNEGDDAMPLDVLVNEGDGTMPLDVLVNKGDEAMPLTVLVNEGDDAMLMVVLVNEGDDAILLAVLVNEEVAKLLVVLVNGEAAMLPLVALVNKEDDSAEEEPDMLKGDAFLVFGSESVESSPEVTDGTATELELKPAVEVSDPNLNIDVEEVGTEAEIDGTLPPVVRLLLEEIGLVKLPDKIDAVAETDGPKIDGGK